MLEHGGRLRQAAVQYSIPIADWLDLSTGINPDGWLVPTVPTSAWGQLPEDNDGLEQAAREYYNAEYLLPVAGSQAAIQALPQLRAPSRVGVFDPGYAEHRHAWQRAEHFVTPVTAKSVDQAVSELEVLVLIHPNNPTGECFPVEQLLAWYGQLATHGGWLVIDEAFMDATPEMSLVPHATRPGLIVLRSLGKFFGLAGARVGFVCAQPELLTRLNAMLGPWTLSTPARWVASAALRDRAWQQTFRQRLLDNSARLRALLTRHELAPDGGCVLFQWVRTPQAAAMHERLAHQGILTRLFTDPPSLRFGLPNTEANWQRLDTALVHAAACDLAWVNPCAPARR
ncbi:MAG: threonine-phosphate decarboxylase CobD [Pseudomonadota bacterium]